MITLPSSTPSPLGLCDVFAMTAPAVGTTALGPPWRTGKHGRRPVVCSEAVVSQRWTSWGISQAGQYEQGKGLGRERGREQSPTSTESKSLLCSNGANGLGLPRRPSRRTEKSIWVQPICLFLSCQTARNGLVPTDVIQENPVCFTDSDGSDHRAEPDPAILPPQPPHPCKTSSALLPNLQTIQIFCEFGGGRGVRRTRDQATRSLRFL